MKPGVDGEVFIANEAGENYRKKKDRNYVQFTLSYHGLAISPQNLKINAKLLSAHVLVQ